VQLTLHHLKQLLTNRSLPANMVKSFQGVLCVVCSHSGKAHPDTAPVVLLLPPAQLLQVTSGMICLKCCCRQVALGMPTSALTATACRLSDERVTWSKSTSRSRPTPDRSNKCAAWLPTPWAQQQQQQQQPAAGSNRMTVLADHPVLTKTPVAWSASQYGASEHATAAVF